jgi:hypothetical protein
MRAAIGKMLHSMFRERTAFPKMPERTRRPAIFTLLFWSVLAVTCVSYAFGPKREDWYSGFLPVAVVALVVVWTVMPWDSRASRRRKLVAPLFLIGVVALGVLTKSVWSFGLYAVPFANGVFAFGFVRGGVYATAVLPFIFANYAYLLASLYPGREAAASQALLLTVLWIPVAVFVIGVCAGRPSTTIASSGASGRKPEATCSRTHRRMSWSRP